MIQPLSFIHPEAQVAKNVIVDPFSTIDKNVVIGDGTWIGPNVTIMEGARIGKQCKIKFEPPRWISRFLIGNDSNAI